jgi:hypothetical protein
MFYFLVPGAIHSHVPVPSHRAHQPHLGGYIDDNEDEEGDDGDDDDIRAGRDANDAAVQHAKSALSEYAIGLGFHPVHVAEGLKSNVSRENLLDWLCLFVPEQDLPPKFRPQHAQLAAMKFDTDSLAAHYKATRLAAYGFAYVDCVAALGKVAGDEVGALHVRAPFFFFLFFF